MVGASASTIGVKICNDFFIFCIHLDPLDALHTSPLLPRPAALRRFGYRLDLMQV